MKLLKTSCRLCKKEFFVWPYRLKNNKKLFCSRSCLGKRDYGRVAPAEKVIVKCVVCFKSIIRYKSTLKRKRAICCSIQCRYKYLGIINSSKNHPMWKGKEVSYMGGHARVRREKGSPIKCSECGVLSSSTKIQWASINHRYWDVNDYKSLCIKCHRNLDKESYLNYKKAKRYSYKGQKLTLTQFAIKYGINKYTLKTRIYNQKLKIKQAIEK